MSEPKWTVPPWRVTNPHGYADRVVADVPFGEGIIASFGESDTSDTQIMANATLIAAAPELYTIAAEAPILSQYHGQRGFEVECFIADYEAWSGKRRAVIAKARGEFHGFTVEQIAAGLTTPASGETK